MSSSITTRIVPTPLLTGKTTDNQRRLTILLSMSHASTTFKVYLKCYLIVIIESTYFRNLNHDLLRNIMVIHRSF